MVFAILKKREKINSLLYLPLPALAIKQFIYMTVFFIFLNTIKMTYLSGQNSNIICVDKSSLKSHLK